MYGFNKFLPVLYLLAIIRLFLCSITVAGSNILGDISSFTIAELEEIGVGLNMALVWEESLHNALMPITPQASMGSLAESML